MKKNNSIILLFILLTALFLVPSGIAEIEIRNGSFSTDKGTSVSINSTLEFQDQTDEGKPILRINNSYTLTIQITLNKLGNDVRDFHDLEFNIEIVSSGLIGGETSYYNGYYFDSTSRLTEDDQIKSYSFEIFLAGYFEETDATIDIVFSGKENVANARDPTSSFENIGYEVLLTSSGSTNLDDLSGSETVERILQVSADEETQLKITTNVKHDGLSNNGTGKPTFVSGEKYLISITVSILELGIDAKDFHDFQVSISMEDESITDFIPGSTTKIYYSSQIFDNTKLVEGNNSTYNVVLFPSTNINDTEFVINFEFKGKEAVDMNIDPTSEFSLGLEGELNVNKENKGGIFTGTDETSLGSWLTFVTGLMLILILSTITRRKHE